jgi:hypothetical protein
MSDDAVKTEYTDSSRIPTIRTGAITSVAEAKLGFLGELHGTWEGTGFNLIARPDKQGGSPLFLELNQTFEVLNIVPISSQIPNRGSAVNDIELAGLTYLQKVSDLVTMGALHIEPGIWIHIPSQDSADGKTQSVARMGTIPHGNSLLAQGIAIKVASLPGNTFDPTKTSSTTTAPFPVTNPPTPMPAQGTRGGFPEYTLTNVTPFRTPASEIPDPIQGVPLQQLIDNPTRLLTAALKGQEIEKMVVIQIATIPSLFQAQNPPASGGAAPAPVDILKGIGGGGGVENIPFVTANADITTVFATFWIETIKAPDGTSFLQLQYVQTVLLNFPVIKPGVPPGPLLAWPHVSVATLRKTFGGQ